MIQDGVCDEIANIARCLFDGGDCCRPDKSTQLCNICVCKADVDLEALNNSYLTHDVQVFKNSSDYDDLITDIVKTVENVETLNTCSHLCLDNDIENRVNSWSYNLVSKLCDCTWIDIDASYCSGNRSDIQMVSIFDYNSLKDAWYNPTVAMVNTNKSLPCSKTICTRISIIHWFLYRLHAALRQGW